MRTITGEQKLPEHLFLGTYTGRLVDICQEPLTISEIARGLSLMPRCSGQTPVRYSVAEHSFHVAETLERELVAERFGREMVREACLAALLHDCCEAVMTDIPTPLKSHLPMYEALEKRFLSINYRHFGLETCAKALEKSSSYWVLDAVKEADAQQWERERVDGFDYLRAHSLPSWKDAEDLFISAFFVLQDSPFAGSRTLGDLKRMVLGGA